MDNFIPSHKIKGHIVNKYKYKLLDGSSNPTVEKTKEESKYESLNFPPAQIPEKNELEEFKREQEKQKDEILTLLKDNLVDKLLTKIDDLSENLNNLQNQFANQRDDFEERLKVEVQRGYSDGLKDGEEKLKGQFEAVYNDINSRMVEAIEALEDEGKKFDIALSNMEKELTSVAIDIAKEILESELDKDSAKIATNLAKALMENIRDAKDIILKVNPDDFEKIRDNFEKNLVVKVEKSSAISKGGVVIVSDIGNIDGSVMTRFLNLKKAIVNSRYMNEEEE